MAEPHGAGGKGNSGHGHEVGFKAGAELLQRGSTSFLVTAHVPTA